MGKIAVIYKSNYGATKKYAEWIADELGAELIEREDASADTLKAYDCIIYGGGLYASGVIGSDLVAKNACKNLVVFTVGLADPANTDYSNILSRAFPKQEYQPQKVFHFRGAIDYGQLRFLHRNLMKLLKKSVEKKPISERSEEDKAMLETYGKQIDFTDHSTIEPLVAYVTEVIENR